MGHSTVKGQVLLHQRSKFKLTVQMSFFLIILFNISRICTETIRPPAFFIFNLFQIYVNKLFYPICDVDKIKFKLMYKTNYQSFHMTLHSFRIL